MASSSTSNNPSVQFDMRDNDRLTLDEFIATYLVLPKFNQTVSVPLSIYDTISSKSFNFNKPDEPPTITANSFACRHVAYERCFDQRLGMVFQITECKENSRLVGVKFNITLNAVAGNQYLQHSCLAIFPSSVEFLKTKTTHVS